MAAGATVGRGPSPPKLTRRESRILLYERGGGPGLVLFGRIAHLVAVAGRRRVPEGPAGLTIADYLRRLDRRFRVVGSTYYNHLPTAKPEYIPGFHPIDFQPLCEQFTSDFVPRCASPTGSTPYNGSIGRGPFRRLRCRIPHRVDADASTSVRARGRAS